MSVADPATLAMLRAHIARVAPARVHPGQLVTGIDALDTLVGGWPRPGLSSVIGAAGTGRFRLLLPMMRALTRGGQPVAIIDPLGWLHPAGLPGVDWPQLLLVRPGAGRTAWTAEQLARCGELGLLLVLDPPRLGRGGRRLLHAAEHGETAVILLTEAPDPDLPTALRLEMHPPDGVTVQRGARSGRPEHLRLPPDATLPPWFASSPRSS